VTQALPHYTTMAFSVVMPALEMAQETGKLLAWRKKEGDSVSKGEPLLEIETDKAVVEVEAPADGVLAGIRASEGAEIPVGQTIAWIVGPGEQPPNDTGPAVPAARATSQSKSEQASNLTQGVSSSPPVSTKISPKAKRLAKELAVDIGSLRGSGPGGEILASDVQAAGVIPADSTRNKSIEMPTTLGRIMAERTTQSWTTVPHFFLTRDVDASGLKQYRDKIIDQIESTNSVRVTHTDLLVGLVSRVLLKHPRMNASWSAGGIRLHDHVNMGVAIAVDDGVVAAVIHNAQSASLAEIATQRRDIAERARAGRLRPADIADATFTISNLGMYQVDRFCAIITPPQAAILAVGRIADRVVAVEGEPVVRPIISMTISCDHRVADGARAAMFLSDLAEALRKPSKLLD
jgi:pyruvate dehydrogenase E2 component (dihydrolipoyllysine-residue acetyltransferase)